MRYFSIMLIVISFYTQGLCITNSDFLSLLKEYGAWDIYEFELQNNKSESALLESAKAKLLLDDPDGAIKIISQLKDFKISRNKGIMELILARAYRIKGDFLNSVTHYSTALTYLDKKTLLAEPDIFELYKNTILRECINTYNFLSMSKDKKDLLLFNIEVAKKLWPNFTLWDKVYEVLTKDISTINFHISNKKIKKHLILYLAALSINDVKQIDSLISSINEDDYKDLLNSLKYIFFTGLSNFNSRIDSNYPKTTAYLEIMDYYIKQNKDNWLIPINDTKLQSFLQRLWSLNYIDAISQIDKELTSLFLDKETKETLKKIKLSYLLLSENYEKIKEELSNIKFSSLPLTLKIAILLNTNEVNVKKLGISHDELKCIDIFLSAFGFDPFHQYANFFLNKKEMEQKIKDFPLDYLLRYAFLRAKTITKSISIDELKQGAYLYREFNLGQRCILLLSQKYLKNRNYHLFNKYISFINPQSFDRELLLTYYKIVGDYYKDTNQIEQAINFYEKLFQIDPRYVSPTELIKIALLIQRNKNLDLAEKIFNYLWKNKDTLDRKLQAETLFWLAETQQLKDKLNLAIKNYLKVYFYYKDEYIWSITALYRAGLIYEQKGMLSTAKKIFNDVLKNAKRKSEKEAARARLKQLKDKNKNQLQEILWF